MSQGDVLCPGEIIKPSLTQVPLNTTSIISDIFWRNKYYFQATAGELLTKLYGFTPKSVKEFNSYDDRNFYFTVKEAGEGVWPHGYILKVDTVGLDTNQQSVPQID